MLIDVTHLSTTQCKKPIRTYLKYGTPKNFVGQIIDGYATDAIDFALMSPKAAHDLCKVQNELIEQHNYGLLILDAYRPKRAIYHFMRWATMPPISDYELLRKEKHYPHIEKDQLFALGYVAEDSSHCYGNAVDVLLIDLETLEKRPLGACFDYMDKLSNIHTGPEIIGQEAFDNRQILSNAMMKYDFEPYEEEFWHFTHGGILGRETNTALDIPITNELKGT